VRVSAANASASAAPCVDVALNRTEGHVTHETRTPWDWVLRLPPLNVLVDAVFTTSGFLLLPMLYRSFKRRGVASRKLCVHSIRSSISETFAAAQAHTTGARLWLRALSVMISSRFYTCMFGMLWLWGSSGRAAFGSCFNRFA
jgi:hypothetical protein